MFFLFCFGLELMAVEMVLIDLALEIVSGRSSGIKSPNSTSTVVLINVYYISYFKKFPKASE